MGFRLILLLFVISLTTTIASTITAPPITLSTQGGLIARLPTPSTSSFWNCDGRSIFFCPPSGGTCYLGQDGYVGCCTATSCAARTTCIPYTRGVTQTCDPDTGGCVVCSNPSTPSCVTIHNAFNGAYIMYCDVQAQEITLTYTPLITTGSVAVLPTTTSSSSTSLTPASTATSALSSATATSTTPAVLEKTENKSSGLSSGALAGIFVGSACGAAIFVGVILWLSRRRRREREASVSNVNANAATGSGTPKRGQSQNQSLAVENLHNNSSTTLREPWRTTRSTDAALNGSYHSLANLNQPQTQNSPTGPSRQITASRDPRLRSPDTDTGLGSDKKNVHELADTPASSSFSYTPARMHSSGASSQQTHSSRRAQGEWLLSPHPEHTVPPTPDIQNPSTATRSTNTFPNTSYPHPNINSTANSRAKSSSRNSFQPYRPSPTRVNGGDLGTEGGRENRPWSVYSDPYSYSASARQTSFSEMPGSPLRSDPNPATERVGSSARDRASIRAVYPSGTFSVIGGANPVPAHRDSVNKGSATDEMYVVSPMVGSVANTTPLMDGWGSGDAPSVGGRTPKGLGLASTSNGSGVDNGKIADGADQKEEEMNSPRPSATLDGPVNWPSRDTRENRQRRQEYMAKRRGAVSYDMGNGEGSGEGKGIKRTLTNATGESGERWVSAEEALANGLHDGGMGEEEGEDEGVGTAK